MGKQTSFAHQRRVLEQFLSLLKTFESDFNLLIRKFDENITYLYENQGLMEEIYDEYKSTYLSSMNSTLLDIQTRIHEEDIPFVEKEIDFISSR
jgi:hypothetical protein